MLRAYKFPTTKSFVISTFMRLIEHTSLAEKMQSTDGSWDFKKLYHWYHRQFLPGDDLLHTGTQRPLDVNRDAWGTAENAKIYFDTTRDMLLKANPDSVQL